MGTAGPGVFDNDYALDVYEEEIVKLKKQLDELLDDPSTGLDDIEGPLALVQMLAVLAQHCRPIWLPHATLEHWWERFLEIYDAEIDDFEPTPEYKRDRRKVIEETFNRLLPYIREPEGTPSADRTALEARLFGPPKKEGNDEGSNN